MLEESNSLNPYKYFSNKSSSRTYSFFSNSGSEFSAYFIDGSDYFPDYPAFNYNILSFGFSLIKDSGFKQERDTRIRDTIISIITEFLIVHPETALFTVCDTSDNKHAFRNQLFSKWFSQFNPVFDLKFSKYNLRICNEDGECAYCSLIIHKDCSRHEEIKNAFLNLDNDLTEKGY